MRELRRRGRQKSGILIIREKTDQFMSTKPQSLLLKYLKPFEQIKLIEIESVKKHISELKTIIRSK